MNLCDEAARADLKFLCPVMFVFLAYGPAVYGNDQSKSVKHAHRNA
jgi:hypothetical protein